MALCPGCTVSAYQNAHLVPACCGFTVAAPLTTWSLMPSFGNLVTGWQLKTRSLLVSFSQNSGVGTVPSDAGPASSSSAPRKGWSMSTVLAVSSAASLAASRSDGLAEPSQDQVLRNHAVGSTWIVSASRPSFVTLISTSRSAASSLLAYVTSVTQYRSWSKTPVSRISYSGARRSRRALSARSSS